MRKNFRYVHVDNNGKLDTLNIQLKETGLNLNGTLSEVPHFKSADFLTFFESNKSLWKITPNSASFFEIDDNLLTPALLEVIASGILLPKQFEQEIVNLDWVETLPEEEFSSFKNLVLNYDVEFATRALVINGYVYGIFFNFERPILIKMDPDTEFSTPYFDSSVASFSISCLGSRVSGTDSFYLLQNTIRDFYIFGNLDDRMNKFYWLPKHLTTKDAVIEFLNFIRTSGEIPQLSQAGIVAAIYDTINGWNEDHFLEEHSHLSEHDPYAPAEHYFGLQEFEIDLFFNVPNEIIQEILNVELLALPKEIARRITFGEYCCQTAGYAGPVDFNESEWSVVSKYDSFIHHSVEDAFREFDSAAKAVKNRPKATKKARELLGIEGDDLTNLLSKTNAIIRKNPRNESDYWEAYWVLRDEPSMKRLKEAEVQKQLAEEIRSAVENLNWPKDWHPKYAAVWSSLGGTALSADRWFKKGWRIDQILFQEQLPAEWNGSLTERVRLLDPPEQL